MDTIGVRDLRTDLAASLRRAETGERLVVTVGGRPVAQIAPLGDDGGAATLEGLAARGLVLPPARQDRPEPAASIPLWAGARLDRILSEIR